MGFKRSSSPLKVFEKPVGVHLWRKLIHFKNSQSDLGDK